MKLHDGILSLRQLCMTCATAVQASSTPQTEEPLRSTLVSSMSLPVLLFILEDVRLPWQPSFMLAPLCPADRIGFCQIWNSTYHAGLEVASLIGVHRRMVDDKPLMESTHKMYGQVLLASSRNVCCFMLWPVLIQITTGSCIHSLPSMTLSCTYLKNQHGLHQIWDSCHFE